MDNPISERIKDYIQGRASTRLEKWDKDAEKIVQSSPEKAGELADLRAAELAKYETRTWLSDAAVRAQKISFATHPLKFTHSSAQGSSVYIAASGMSFPYLCTATLQKPRVDIAVDDAKHLDVVGLMTEDVDGITLANQIESGDWSALEVFAKDEEQLNEWKSGFQLAFGGKALRSHALAKQIYFPVADNQYHLASPLFASSLAQMVFERVKETRTPEAKAIRELKKKSLWSLVNVVSYPKLAVQTFGGQQPQNVSRLNTKSQRNGQVFLLNASPPIWQSQAKPPSESRDAFWRQLDQLTWRKTRDLKAFLIRVADRNNIRIREKRAEWVDDLIDILLQYAASIQAMRELAGWSAASKLLPAEQLWLDPWRAKDDADFRAQREKNDWQVKIAQQFAFWLNEKLSDKALLMGDAEYREWEGELSEKLARLRDDIDYLQEGEQ